MPETLTDPVAELFGDLGSLTHDPYKFVIYAYPWGEGELLNHQGPDVWQTKVLCEIRDKLAANKNLPLKVILEAISSGHGPGKTALVCWLIHWAIATCADTHGVVTANTEAQLKTKTWAELSKWHRLFIAKDFFELTATAIYSKQPEHEHTWRIDQVAWSEEKSEAFAGLHNQGKRIIVIFDESSAIPDKIWEVTEGALTDKDTEIIWLVCGNPTRNTGRFHACFNTLRHRWNTHQVDSRTAKMANQEQIQQWIEDYGEDSDFCRVRIKGEFPNVSDRQFIPTSYVTQARTRKLSLMMYDFAPKIIGVDPSWTGSDEFTIYLRQGNFCKQLGKYRKNDDDFQMAGYISKFEDIEKADAVFVDLGFGTGIVSAGKQMQRNWVLVAFGGKSTTPGMANKRTEMWYDMKQWLKDGGMIPDDPILAAELVGPEYYVIPTGRNAGKTILESKEDMKRRGISSPNRADALALTFAYPVLPKNRMFDRRIDTIQIIQPQYSLENYDPLKGV